MFEADDTTTRSDNKNWFIICSETFFAAEHRLCDINFCRNGGTCYRYGNATGCSCAPGFTGKFCDNGTMPHTCN